MTTRWFQLCFACGYLLLAAEAAAQSTIASHVLEPSFERVPGVVVGIVGPATDELQLLTSFMPSLFEAIPFNETVTTDDKGQFEFRDLPPGVYLVAFYKEGYREVRGHVPVPNEFEFLSPVNMRQVITGYILFASCYEAFDGNLGLALDRSRQGSCAEDNDDILIAPSEAGSAIYHVVGGLSDGGWLARVGSEVRAAGKITPAEDDGEFNIHAGSLESTDGRAGWSGWRFEPR